MDAYFKENNYFKNTNMNMVVLNIFLRKVAQAIKDIFGRGAVLAKEITRMFDLRRVEDTFLLIQTVQNILSAHLRTHKRMVN